MTGDRGSVTAFVVVLAVSLLALVGLVYDGGRLVAAHLVASDHAAAAARAGAQAVVGIRADHLQIDPLAATGAAQTYLAVHGATGSIEATPLAVSVTVRRSVAFALLTLVGVSGREVSATRTSVAVRQ